MTANTQIIKCFIMAGKANWVKSSSLSCWPTKREATFCKTRGRQNAWTRKATSGTAAAMQTRTEAESGAVVSEVGGISTTAPTHSVLFKAPKAPTWKPSLNDTGWWKTTCVATDWWEAWLLICIKRHLQPPLNILSQIWGDAGEVSRCFDHKRTKVHQLEVWSTTSWPGKYLK